MGTGSKSVQHHPSLPSDPSSPDPSPTTPRAHYVAILPGNTSLSLMLPLILLSNVALFLYASFRLVSDIGRAPGPGRSVIASSPRVGDSARLLSSCGSGSLVPLPEAVMRLLLLFSSSQEFNFPRLGGSSDTGSGVVGLSGPMESARILTMLRCVVPTDSESEWRGEYCESRCAPGNSVEELRGGSLKTLLSS